MKDLNLYVNNKPLKTMARSVDGLQYYHRTFSLVVEFDGGSKYTSSKYVFSVYDELDKRLVHLEEMTCSFESADRRFEQLKDRFLFDYEKILKASHEH